MNKNIMKAAIYTVIGVAIVIAALVGIPAMYFSKTFIPVYISGKYVLGNQIVRYIIYLILFALVVLGIKLAAYGLDFLIKKISKMKRRH